MLDNLHKSILWIVRMSVLHDFCRAWFRVAEGRTFSVHLKCVQTVPTCCGPSLYVKPQPLLCDSVMTETVHLSLRRSVEGGGGGPMETSLFSHQLLSCSLFLISQEAPRGRCLDCHHPAPLSFHTVFNSDMLSLPPLSVFISINAHTHFIFPHLLS